ncbi:transcription initiation factor IIF, beta subunit-domain-containing protein [Irpex rosettiformis]|uniref:Transcription initiation factor IIF, beta subunit-domain-containing protein n=1 Tax=Irpex rosettiformis TaxID=378272 RepID=A0ACB8UA06_9APHY|nr:transcription initiation factor IIF, beta subunit-domain-containing protein [Irpex rosettiformis]
MDTMEDSVMEDEKKPFDAEHPTNDHDVQPDPDEELIMQANNGRVWLVKIPRHLMEQWSSIDEEGVELAKIRVYQKAYSANGRQPRITLQLPAGPGGAPGDMYELDMVNDSVENQFVIAEREKEPGTGSRARTTIMTGRVKHECNLRPQLSDKYRQRLKQRVMAANQPRRTIKRIEDEHPGDRGTINRLTSGVTNTGGFSDLIKPKTKPAKGQFERMARMPRNQLLDMLFSLFREREHWPVRMLRERTQQPEAYLKEVLGEIAFMHRSGEHNGTWELMANYKGEGIKGENVPGPSLSGDVSPKAEDAMDEDDDDSDDEDMEEVS